MTNSISYQALSAHILRHAAADHVAGATLKPAQRSSALTAERLAIDLGVRRVDVRRALSALHKQGLMDVAQMRLTLAGFALGKALEGRQLKALRVSRASNVGAARAA